MNYAWYWFDRHLQELALAFWGLSGFEDGAEESQTEIGLTDALIKSLIDSLWHHCFVGHEACSASWMVVAALWWKIRGMQVDCV